MKLPNSYGSVIKLGGKRRKPYAVRISKLVEDDTGKVKRKYTYLAYFSKPEMAYTYLAEYNSGAVVPEHMKYYLHLLQIMVCTYGIGQASLEYREDRFSVAPTIFTLSLNCYSLLAQYVLRLCV